MTAFKEYIKQHSSLTDEQFSILSQGLVTKMVDKGEMLLIANTHCKWIFFVCKGLLRSYIIDSNGKEHIIQFAPETFLIGDRNSVIFNQTTQFYVDAIERSEVVMINNDFIMAASNLCPHFALFNAHRLNSYITYTQNRLGQLLAATAEERYAKFLQTYPNLSPRLSQIMISSYLGITPESLSRIRRTMAKKKLG